MNHKKILGKFCFEFDFKQFSKSWKSGTTENFLNLIKFINEAGFDLWQTDVKTELVRFGLKDIGDKKAKFVLGIIKYKTKPTLKLISLTGKASNIEYSISENLSKILENSLEKYISKLKKEGNYEVRDQGNWPDQYLISNNKNNKLSKYFSLLVEEGDTNKQDLDKIIFDEKIKETEKIALIQARIGQGEFRKKVIHRAKGKCEVTGIDDESMLIASHIVAWADCKNSTQRLDPNNGLLLTPNLDKLFDKGYISFKDDGQIMCKKHKDLILKLLNIKSLEKIKLINIPNQQQCEYLKQHREKYNFIDWDNF